MSGGWTGPRLRPIGDASKPSPDPNGSAFLLVKADVVAWEDLRDHHPRVARRGLSVGYRAGAPGSGTALLGGVRRAVGGGRSVGAAASAWRTAVRWSSGGVEGLVVQSAHDGGDGLLDLG